LEFNVPFQHIHGYIKDETNRGEKLPLPSRGGGN